MTKYNIEQKVKICDWFLDNLKSYIMMDDNENIIIRFLDLKFPRNTKRNLLDIINATKRS